MLFAYLVGAGSTGASRCGSRSPCRLAFGCGSFLVCHTNRLISRCSQVGKPHVTETWLRRQGSTSAYSLVPGHTFLGSGQDLPSRQGRPPGSGVTKMIQSTIADASADSINPALTAGCIAYSKQWPDPRGATSQTDVFLVLLRITPGPMPWS